MTRHAAIIAAIVAIGAYINWQISVLGSVLASAEDRAARRPSTAFVLHPGRGLWDDFADLFDDDKRWALPPEHAFALESEFQKTFRLDRFAFMFVANAIRESVERQPGARGPEPMECERSLAICLLHLAHGYTYHTVCTNLRNGLCEATVGRTVRLVTRAIVLNLKHLIHFPRTEAGRSAIASVFELRSLIPNILGAIDGTHVRVSPKRREQLSYINRKGYYSVLVSAVCDYRGYFMSVDLGFPGKMGDSRALQLSPLWTTAWEMFGKHGYYLYGDSGYPLLMWLLVGFRGLATCTAEQLKFNQYGSRARVIIECAFGKVKGQWRCLMGGLRTRSWDDWNVTILACFILHNVTIRLMGQGWKRHDDFHTGRPPQNDIAHSAFPEDPNELGTSQQRGNDNRRAKRRRERLFQELRERW